LPGEVNGRDAVEVLEELLGEKDRFRPGLERGDSALGQPSRLTERAETRAQTISRGGGGSSGRAAPEAPRCTKATSASGPKSQAGPGRQSPFRDPLTPSKRMAPPLGTPPHPPTPPRPSASPQRRLVLLIELNDRDDA
jgi:hypothetical protein